MKIKRVFHRWESCEEYKTNMWKTVPVEIRDSLQDQSRNLMIEYDSFEFVCKQVVDAWPNSCEAALSASTMNHQAWIGHAACAFNHNAPEDITRLAWRTLSQEQQDLANAAAANAIAYWRDKYISRMKNA